MVIWTKPAKADLQHIFQIIAEDSKHYAHKVTQEIVEKADILEQLPNMGKVVPALIKDGGNIEILRVFHGALEIEKYLK